MEEAVTNSWYHRDYTQYEPVTVTIEPDGITITSIPGPDRSIPLEAIKEGQMFRSRRYRNRRLGDFLKELDLTEGRSTGIPTIQSALKDNGSPKAEFLTDDLRSFTEVFIPVHKNIVASQNEPQNEPQKLTLLQIEILKLIKNNPQITRTQIADKTNKGLATVKRAIKDLSKLRYEGPSKGGHWVIDD